MKLLSNKDDIKNLSLNPGIYAIRNIVNNKYYIGLSLILRKRILRHISNFYNKFKFEYPIYKAFRKYGLDKFEVIELSILDNNIDKTIIKQELDKLEKQFIEQYNSYGNTGYNQTLGGDGGILGYKFTDEQRINTGLNTKKIMSDGRNKIYCYNIDTKNIILFNTKYELMTYFNIDKFSNGCIRNLIFNNSYIIARDELILNEKIIAFNNKTDNNYWINGIAKKIPDGFKDYLLTHTNKEICKFFNISRPLIYKWRKLLNIT